MLNLPQVYLAIPVNELLFFLFVQYISSFTS